MNIHTYWSGDRPHCVLGIVHEPDYRQLPPELLLPRARQTLQDWPASAANLPPAFFPDMGTCSTATSWGAQPRQTDNGEWFAPPVASSIDEALAIEPIDNPHLELALQMFLRLRDETGLADLGLKSIDFQGPLNTAALVLQQDELLVAMYTDPDKVHALLGRITDHLIQTFQSLRDRAGRLDGNIWPYLWVPDGCGVMLTEDMMPLLSPQQYKEFGLPYLKRISDAFGGVFIHCCGEWGRHAANLAESGVKLLGAEFHYPFTRIEELAGPLQGCVLAPFYAGFRTNDFGGGTGYIDHLLAHRPEGISYWFAQTTADRAALAATAEILARHGFEPVTFENA